MKAASSPVTNGKIAAVTPPIIVDTTVAPIMMITNPAAASGVRRTEWERVAEAIELFQSDGRGTESEDRDANGPVGATASLREDYLGPRLAPSAWP